MRRNALNPFFSTQTVHRLQSVVEERADALLDALVKYAKSHQGKPLNVMYPFSAFTYGKMTLIPFVWRIDADFGECRCD
jgi:hypothetical protein